MSRIRKRRRAWLVGILVLAAVAVFTVSCATKPAPVGPEPTVEVPKPEKEYQTAKELRATVTQFNLDRYEADAFKKAEASFKDGEKAYDKDNVKSKAAFDKAIAGYRQVLDSGFPALAGERRKLAEDAKAEADALKAAVAVKADYAAALKQYNQAVEAEKAKDYPKSLQLFDQSEAGFAAAALKARQLKARAEGSIDAVKENLAEAEKQAAEAEKVREEGGL